MKARLAISGGTFDPGMVKMLCGILDEVWALVADRFDGDAQAIEEARLELATTIIDLARDRQLDASQIARTALRITRERRRAPAR